jgi:hypothetical protein
LCEDLLGWWIHPCVKVGWIIEIVGVVVLENIQTDSSFCGSMITQGIDPVKQTGARVTG